MKQGPQQPELPYPAHQAAMPQPQPVQSGMQYPDQQAGMPYPQPGMPYSPPTQTRMPYPQPGMPYSPPTQTGMPYPQPVQSGMQYPDQQAGMPYPQTGMPYSPPTQTGMPYPQPVQSGMQYPGQQAGMPYPQTGMPYPQAGMSYPQPVQSGMQHPGQQAAMPYPQPTQQPIMMQPAHQPLMMQPGQPPFMPAPPPIPGCPPGLEYLAHLDQVVIKQDVSLLEAFTGFDALNSYRIFNSMGQQIYTAGEESNCCARNMCTTQRGFIYHVTNNLNQEVFRVNRDFNCFAGERCWPCDCCRYYADVFDVQGRRLGYVSDRFTVCACRAFFGMYDEWQNLTAEMRGPFFDCQNCLCANDVEFPVYDVTKGDTAPPFGMIAKTWEGMLKDCFTTADNFIVKFPVDLEIRTKVLMISAVLIIDMMLYEDQDKSEGNKGPTQ